MIKIITIDRECGTGAAEIAPHETVNCENHSSG